MLIFKCDICGQHEDLKASTFKLPTRDDICKDCLEHLDKCGDLLNTKGFKKELKALHAKFFPKGKPTKDS